MISSLFALKKCIDRAVRETYKYLDSVISLKIIFFIHVLHTKC